MQARAHRDATFQAGWGAAAVAAAFGEAESAMVGLARGLPVAALLRNPANCQLTFAD